jgi:hypothetical protein
VPAKILIMTSRQHMPSDTVLSGDPSIFFLRTKYWLSSESYQGHDCHCYISSTTCHHSHRSRPCHVCSHECTLREDSSAIFDNASPKPVFIVVYLYYLDHAVDWMMPVKDVKDILINVFFFYSGSFINIYLLEFLLLFQGFQL